VADIDEKARSIGVSVHNNSSAKKWRCRSITAQDEDESGGKHAIMLYLVRDGLPASNVKVQFWWPKGEPGEPNHSDVYTGAAGEYEYIIWDGFDPAKEEGAYYLLVADGKPTDVPRGFGLPLNRHWVFNVVMEWVDGTQPAPVPAPVPPPDTGTSNYVTIEQAIVIAEGVAGYLKELVKK